MRLVLLRPGVVTLIAPLLFSVTPPAAASQSGEGRHIQARDGDVVVIDEGDRVDIVRRRQAEIRAIYNAEQDWLLILADYASQPGGRPDGAVDFSYSFSELSGAWPLGERWQGPAHVEEYSRAAQPGLHGFQFHTAAGTISLSPSGPAANLAAPSDAHRIVYRSAGVSGAGGLSFDVVEERQAAVAAKNAELRRALPGGGISSQAGMSVLTPAAPGDAPIRVGGRVRPPKKIAHAEPVLPAPAHAAGIEGVVLLEVTIDATGAVSNARVLRSLPMLDDAALEAVRQWRYEPAELNGQPVSVVMTVPVEFRK